MGRIAVWCLALSLWAQPSEPARVFGPALAGVLAKVRIPILLPAELPASIRIDNIKMVHGEPHDGGYSIDLYYEEPGSNATFAARFAASTESFDDFNAVRIRLVRGVTGMFQPVQCGGSCAPANLWWVEGGVTYQIQLKLRSDLPEREQQQVLVDTANSLVEVRR